MDHHLDRIFSALADPTRRAILEMLLEDDMAVTDVAEPFSMSLAAISKHLVILAEAGLIQQERRGRVKWCKLDPSALKSASVWMQGFGQFEPVDLDAFERFLEGELSDQGLLDSADADAVPSPSADDGAAGNHGAHVRAEGVTTAPASVDARAEKPSFWPFSRR